MLAVTSASNKIDYLSFLRGKLPNNSDGIQKWESFYFFIIFFPPFLPVILAATSKMEDSHEMKSNHKKKVVVRCTSLKWPNFFWNADEFQHP